MKNKLFIYGLIFSLFFVSCQNQMAFEQKQKTDDLITITVTPKASADSSERAAASPVLSEITSSVKVYAFYARADGYDPITKFFYSSAAGFSVSMKPANWTIQICGYSDTVADITVLNSSTTALQHPVLYNATTHNLTASDTSIALDVYPITVSPNTSELPKMTQISATGHISIDIDLAGVTSAGYSGIEVSSTCIEHSSETIPAFTIEESDVVARKKTCEIDLIPGEHTLIFEMTYNSIFKSQYSCNVISASNARSVGSIVITDDLLNAGATASPVSLVVQDFDDTDVGLSYMPGTIAYNLPIEGNKTHYLIAEIGYGQNISVKYKKYGASSTPLPLTDYTKDDGNKTQMLRYELSSIFADGGDTVLTISITSANGKLTVDYVITLSNLSLPDDNIPLATYLTLQPDADPDSSKTYIISDVRDLVALQTLVNEKAKSFSGCTIKLQSLIDMSSVENWTPIGIDANVFSGTFDGNGFTIENLTSTQESYAGLFGRSYGDIKNLTITGTVTSTGGSAGAFIAHGDYCRIENCTANATVSGKYAGGLIGQITESSNIEIMNCINLGKIAGTDIAGGFVGSSDRSFNLYCSLNFGEVSASVKAGGLIGEISSGTIVNCANLGAVSVPDTGTVYAAGFANHKNQMNIANCYNNGVVTGNNSAAFFCFTGSSGVSATYEYSCLYRVGCASSVNVGSCYSESTYDSYRNASDTVTVKDDSLMSFINVNHEAVNISAARKKEWVRCTSGTYAGFPSLTGSLP